MEDTWPDIITGKTQRRTATALKVGLCAACAPSRFTATRFFGQSLLADHSVPAAAFGMIILGWVEILRMATIPRLSYYREYGAAGGDWMGWAYADGENGWDKNDPHGLYFSGTAASNTTTGNQATFTINGTIVPNAYQGMQIRNDHVGSACYLKSAAILSNTATTITYYYYGGGDRGPPLLFNVGDEFSIRNVLIGLDQNGRGKGDLVTSPNSPRFWPNQQQETCFSWNNKNADTGQVLGYGNNLVPTEHEGSDYVNLGAGLPANQIPAQVTAAYPAGVNGGSAYNHEYTYPHPLVTGGPTPRRPRHQHRLRRHRLLRRHRPQRQH